MSFSSKVKEELIKIDNSEKHCQKAELAAIIAYGAELTGNNRILFQTDHQEMMERFDRLIQNLYGFLPKIHVICHSGHTNSCTYRLSIEESRQVVTILKSIGLMNNLGQIEEDADAMFSNVLQRTCCQRAFLRGAFLSSGSIADPEKNYHFEIVCSSLEKASVVRELIDYFGLEAKVVSRKKYYVAYIKEGAMISDVLSNMGAHISLLDFENIRVVKDVRNSINRRVNCETANINKTVSAARKQIEDIKYISESVGLHKLQTGLQEMAMIRLEEPDLSLKELGAMLTPPVGKSGVNHRLRKISQIADHIREHGYI